MAENGERIFKWKEEQVKQHKFNLQKRSEVTKEHAQ